MSIDVAVSALASFHRYQQHPFLSLLLGGTMGNVSRSGTIGFLGSFFAKVEGRGQTEGKRLGGQQQTADSKQQTQVLEMQVHMTATSSFTRGAVQ